MPQESIIALLSTINYAIVAVAGIIIARKTEKLPTIKEVIICNFRPLVFSRSRSRGWGKTAGLPHSLMPQP